ncbi:MAG: hypothetical protein GQ532_18545, partial [Methylomarinum sp.]|nr:hypothetical protein [Methylomarinum sp.]
MNMLEKALEKAKENEILPEEKSDIKGKEEIAEVSMERAMPIDDTQVSAPPINSTLKKERDVIKFDWDYLHNSGFIRLDKSHNRIAEEYR